MIDVTVFGDSLDDPRCRVIVSGLSPQVAAGLAERIEQVADGYFEIEPNGFRLRDTSLCDGPPAPQSPLIMEAQSGGLRPMAEPRQVSVRWGEDLCEGSCGRLRALDFELSQGEGVDSASLHQGEINDTGRSGVRFANLRSWNSCTDEPDTITWAFWLL